MLLNLKMKRIELLEAMRLLRTKSPYYWEIIIDACTDYTDPVETIVKFHKRYPEKGIIIKEGIQSVKDEIPLYNPNETE